ncbi:MAG: histidine phosphatase family protein [Desulfobacterales bacterium]|nr:MAG: histidine phosphatase family protein [Desulfobacterales bacterium]
MQDISKTTRFGLIRHAQTVWNLEKKIQGHSDSPLTLKGELQASRWGKMLKEFSWNRLLASDTGRALATAEIINADLKIPLTIDSRLREQDWGRWVGKTISQIEAEWPQVVDEQVNAGWNFCPPGGESRHSVLKRSQKALQEAAARHPGEILLVVTHEGVVKSLIYHLCGRKFLPGEPAILESYQLHWLVYRSSGLQIEKVNALDLES